MCGITGFLEVLQSSPAENIQSSKNCTSGAIATHGQNEEGSWMEHEPWIVLGFRRLAIPDYSLPPPVDGPR
jgi:asparagine synthetase B (glutamine-hydrolysing)